MKKLVFVSLLLVILLGCQKVQCPDPYILVGKDCCLDQDHNKICDKDEQKKEASTVTITEQKPQIVEKEVKRYVCSDGSIVASASSCPVQEPEPVAEPEITIPDLVKTNEEGTVIENVTVSTACEYGDQGGDIYFKVGTHPGPISVEAKEVGKSYETVYTRSGLFEGHIRFVICEDCIRGDFRIDRHKVYIMRLVFNQTAVWDRMEYSNEFLIDTRDDTIFTNKVCSG